MNRMFLLVCVCLSAIYSAFGQSVSGEPEISGDYIYTITETMPVYPGGGDKALMAYLTHLILPSCLDSSYVPNKLQLQFVIDTLGDVTRVEVAKSSGIACLDMAFTEHLKAMPRWTPGIMDGKMVSVQLVLPIYVELND